MFSFVNDILPDVLVVYFLQITVFGSMLFYFKFSFLFILLSDLFFISLDFFLLGCLSLTYYYGSKKTYSYFTMFIGLFYGYQLQHLIGLLVGIFFIILSFFIFIPSLLIDFSFFVLPLFISIYGIINQNNTMIEKINLKYEGFNSSVTVCHVSDFHLGAMLKKTFCDKITKIISEIKADVVVITGDLADGSDTVEEEWLKGFKELSMPVLYVTGNHEELHGRNDMLQILKSTNIKHIGNEIFKVKGINFVGVDYYYNLKEKLKEFKPKLTNKENKNTPNILLNHIPQLYPKELEEFNIFLFLSGHTHAGQVFPMHIPAYFLNACFNGLYNYKNKNYAYVSPGVGYANVPMRVFCHSVITEFTIHG